MLLILGDYSLAGKITQFFGRNEKKEDKYKVDMIGNKLKI